MLLTPVFAATPPLTFEFTDIGTEFATDPSHTYIDLNIGVATADRIVIVTFSGDGPDSITISGITIGGVAATMVVSTSAAALSYAAIAYRLVPSGTTATVVVSASGGTLGTSAVGIYTVKNYVSATPTAGATANHSASATSRSATITVSPGGAGFWVVSVGGAISSTIDWTGATEDFDEQPFIGGSRHGGASDAVNSGSIAATASWTGADTCAICAMAWR